MTTTIVFIPTIICIVGPSGAGKTTMARFIEKTLEVPTLVSYTTRPMRAGETNGVEHHFVTEDEMPSRDQMLAYTNFGGYHYWVAMEDVPYTGLGACTYVIDEKGVVDLLQNHGEEFNVKSVLIKRDTELLKKEVGVERVQRDLERLQIPEEDYDSVVENNGRIEDFLADSFVAIKKLLS